MLAGDDDILKAAEDVAARRGAAWRSPPWSRPGARRRGRSARNLVIDEEGNFLGSVSGGCVEGAVVTEAIDVIESGKPKMLEFGVADETAWQVGLSCGGTIRVFVEKVELKRREARDIAAAALNAELRRRGAPRRIVVTDTASGDAAAGQGGGCGARSAARRTRRSGLRSGKSGMARRRTAASSSPCTCRRRASSSSARSISARRWRRWRAIAGYRRDHRRSAHRLRHARAVPRRDADRRMAGGRRCRPLGIDRYTAFVALTHDPKIDDPAAPAALARGCFYVGALGSRRRRTRARRAADASRASTTRRLARIHAPIGLDIGAHSPAEIAVAIWPRSSRRCARPERTRRDAHEVRTGSDRRGRRRASPSTRSARTGSC